MQISIDQAGKMKRRSTVFTTRWWINRSAVIVLWIGQWLRPLAATAREQHPEGMPMWGWHMMEGGWGYGMMFMMFLFWAAILVAIIFLIRWLILTSRRPTMPSTREESALDIAKKRYARGEINKEEFEALRQDIQ